MEVMVRDARDGDWPALVDIAAQGGSPDADPAHLAFLAEAGRLLVADGADGVEGFVGAVPLRGAVMVTDLFVAAGRRGHGVGGALLGAALPAGVGAFTFASADPAALAAYRRVGMAVHWPLLTMRGAACGGSQHQERQWSGTDDAVAGHLRRCGAFSTGHALVGHRGAVAHLHRLEAPAGVVARALAEVCSSLAEGTPIEVSVPAGSPLLNELVLRDFRIVDVDIHCCTSGFVLDPGLAAVHRGLC